MRDKTIQSFINSWKAPYVARELVERFSGGLVKAKTLANADSLGTGPKGAIRFGKRKIAYPKDALAEWIVAQISFRTISN
jgi:hypothetical protein